MYDFTVSYRFGIGMILAVLGLWQPVAAHADDFRISGTFVVTKVRGANIEGTLRGTASPGGDFVGTFAGKQAPGNRKAHADATLDFGGGNTLTYTADLNHDPDTGWLIGTYVITGGTGVFEHATGEGTKILKPNDDGTGEFFHDGSIFFADHP